ncbi:TIGR01212 family radical SAM protein [Thermodesulfobacterium sp. TA1]|uniref:TIGR01212 family radical SAM protein n=1 Tax=Thermodesulfobacterium sp. TA1 TaxID=2234087 RepID=UPI001232C905|nr:TIGR01212 family radical SAM protein [Thermodesulfobacterium sp. TA1]QER41722.1 TIGR01212 family radical SAM protein [Thermodesulfobacterium sp. TA1]
MKNLIFYRSLNSFLKQKFGEKVKKIPLDAGLSCPNRDGTKGYGGCIYCDSKGSGTGLYAEGRTLEKQVLYFLNIYKPKGFNKFIAYFQSFSNTYADPETLKNLYDIVFLDRSIVGLAIGTRPDCISQEVVELLLGYVNLGYYVWVELGLQTIHNETLKKINRGHTFEDFLEAYQLLKKFGLPVVVHIIFGLPGETREMMLETVKTLAKLQIDGIKFHALYIPKGSQLEVLYHQKQITPLDKEEYVSLVAEALTYLPENTVIHRLCSEARKEDLVAPLWVAEKREVVALIQKFMQAHQLYQGKNYNS